MKHIHERVRRVLEQSGCHYDIRRHDQFDVPINNPLDFATALGITPEQIVKTLFLAEQSGAGRNALLSCSATARVDLRAVATVLGYSRVEVAKPADLENKLGFPRHGVSPLGGESDIPVLIDNSVMSLPTILIGAGAVGIEIELTPVDLAMITGGTVGQFIQ